MRKKRWLKEDLLKDVACRESNTRARWVIEWLEARRAKRMTKEVVSIEEARTARRRVRGVSRAEVQ